MPPNKKHKWTFPARFRRQAYGWRSAKPIQRIKEAVSEIKNVARKDPVLGAEGAVLFLEKISPAIEQVDSSSGAIGTAVNKAIEQLAQVIAKAPAEDAVRNKWLKRLWEAVDKDRIPYLDLLPDHWGEMCASPELAFKWADEFINPLRITWSSGPGGYSYYKFTSACLSSLLAAGRYEELIELLNLKPNHLWHNRVWGVKALVAMGKKADALTYAEESRGLNVSPADVASACEEILLSSGLAEEAYKRYAIEANQKSTYLATFRAIVKKYPHKNPSEILDDLVASNPGVAGKWFAAAKSVGLFDQAIELANRTPCDFRTLTRAARDMESSEPKFAMEAALAALYWISNGYAYDVTALDVLHGFNRAVNAGKNAGLYPKVLDRIRDIVEKEINKDRFVAKLLLSRL